MIKLTIEDEIISKRRALCAKIEGLRASTMRYAHVSRSGGIKIADSEPLNELNTQITEVEAKIAAVDAVINEMEQLYEKLGVHNFHELNEQGMRAHDIITSAAPRAWGAFMLTRGQGASIPGRDRTSWLVGDIVALDEYKQQEDQIRSERDTAKEKEAALRETRDKLLILFKSVEGAEPTGADFAT